MTKQEIIGLIKSMVEQKTSKEAYNENESMGIGSNQFRSLASLCSKAECCEEIEMLIAYKMSKAGRNKSWNLAPAGMKSPGDAVLEVIKYIHDHDSSEEERLKSLRLFFGYMYWSARIWSSETRTAGGARK